MTNNYTKTVWVDGSAPAVSASNLGNIEDGVYDAHEGQLDRPIYRGGLHLLRATSDTVTSANTTSTSFVTHGGLRDFYIEKSESNSDLLISCLATCYVYHSGTASGGLRDIDVAYAVQFAGASGEGHRLAWHHFNRTMEHHAVGGTQLFKASSISDIQMTGSLQITPQWAHANATEVRTDTFDSASFDVWELPAGSSPKINAAS